MNELIEWQPYTTLPTKPGRYLVKMWDMSIDVILVEMVVFENDWPDSKWPIYAWAEINGING